MGFACRLIEATIFMAPTAILPIGTVSFKVSQIEIEASFIEA
ncbi:MAG: hypothetical protein QRY72_05600 [Candidatus Rhabdochlamydia sp.]